MFGGSGPVTLFDGTGTYAGITGTIQVTEKFAGIGARYTGSPKKGPCNMSKMCAARLLGEHHRYRAKFRSAKPTRTKGRWPPLPANGCSTGPADRARYRHMLDWFGLGLLDPWWGRRMKHPNALHYVHDDYPQLADISLEAPLPENALKRGTPTCPCDRRYRPQKRDRLGRPPSLPRSPGDSGQMHTDNQALPGPILAIDFIKV